MARSLGRAALLLGACATLGSMALAQNRWYVNASAAAGGTGTLSWNNAFKRLQKAFDNAVSGDEIWVAAGIYVPTATNPFGSSSDPEDVSFTIPDGVEVYGGFDGTELQFSDRTGLYRQTILSGDLGSFGNARHVVVFDEVGWGNHDTILDGFRIEDGVADGPGMHGTNGGGILFRGSRAKIFNCWINDCEAAQGAGMDAEGTEDHPCYLQMLRCRLKNNTAEQHGGGAKMAFGDGSTCQVWNTRFRNNLASQGDGGGMHLFTSAEADDRIDFMNCIWNDNQAQRGGGIHLESVADVSGGTGHFFLYSSTVAYNTCRLPAGGAGVHVDAAMGWRKVAGIHNSIVWDNVQLPQPTAPGLMSNVQGTGTNPLSNGDSNAIVVEYSDVGLPGGLVYDSASSPETNINADPLFHDGGARKLWVKSGSPVVDAANDGNLPLDALDMDGDADFSEHTPQDYGDEHRESNFPSAPGNGQDGGGITGAISDMGAYELQYQPAGS